MSTTTMSANELLEICNKYIAERKEHINNEREKLIAQQVGKRMFWMPWKRFDRESAIAYLKEDHWSAWYWVAVIGGYEKDTIKSLKALAEQSIDGLVQVDAGGAIVLDRVKKRKKYECN